MSKKSILLIDQDHAWLDLLSLSLRKNGYEVDVASDGETAMALAGHKTYDVALMDLGAPDLGGMNIARQIRWISPNTKQIVLTGHPTQESLMEAVREHLFDYLCKPIDFETLNQSILRAVEDGRNATPRHPATLRPDLPAANGRAAGQAEDCPLLVGASEAMCQVRQQIAEVTPTNMTVLIRGESGTGKGVVARMIHEASLRGHKGAFIKINCPAIPETLLESELFGHESGAFTGAEGRKPGRLEMANGGTIFLDEIGEVPPQIQVKLLHVIEHKELQRIGSHQVIHVDARILGATNALLEHMITNGQFRADLFYRLNEYSIYLPPLRHRVEDIPLLVDYFLDLYGREFGHECLTISPEIMSLLLRYPWHGNVRELESVIRRFTLTGREEVIKPLLRLPAVPDAARLETETLRQREIQVLMTALTESRWNQRRAATMLGISYSALRRRIEKYGLKIGGGTPASNPMPASQNCRF